eukprot:4035591-Karenia_brevis.AAC.1
MQRSLDVLSHGFLTQLLGIFSDRVDDLLNKGERISEWTCDVGDVPAPLAMPRRSSRVVRCQRCQRRHWHRTLLCMQCQRACYRFYVVRTSPPSDVYDAYGNSGSEAHLQES